MKEQNSKRKRADLTAKSLVKIGFPQTQLKSWNLINALGNNRYLNISLSLFAAFLFSFASFAQKVHLSGTVTDQLTGKPVAMAHVRVGEVVTYANNKGEFILNVDPSKDQSLVIFHMGYDESYSKIQSEKPYKINLQPVEPSTVPNHTGKEIMTKVFNLIHTNYEVHDQFMLSYYKESIVSNNGSNREQIHYLGEGILEMMISSNVDEAPSFVRPIVTRSQTIDKTEHEGVIHKHGHATEMVEPSVFNKHSFLDEKYRWNFKYNLVGIEKHRDENVFVIDFEPGNRKGKVSGRIYVDELSYAIIRLEYSLHDNLDFDSEVWVEEYQHHDLVYYLLRASFEGKWRENGEEYTFRSLVINSEIEPNHSPTDLAGFVQGEAFSIPTMSRAKFTDDYWGNYNYIKLTDEEKMQMNFTLPSYQVINLPADQLSERPSHDLINSSDNELR